MSFIGPVLNGAQISFRLDHEKFDATVKEFVAAYRDGASQAVKRTGFELLARTILRTTRVKTGRMRNGWFLTFHTPSYWAPKDGVESKPSPGNDQGVKTLFVQNNVGYACVSGETDILTPGGIKPIRDVRREPILGGGGMGEGKGRLEISLSRGYGFALLAGETGSLKMYARAQNIDSGTQKMPNRKKLRLLV